MIMTIEIIAIAYLWVIWFLHEDLYNKYIDREIGLKYEIESNEAFYNLVQAQKEALNACHLSLASKDEMIASLKREIESANRIISLNDQMIKNLETQLALSKALASLPAKKR